MQLAQGQCSNPDSALRGRASRDASILFSVLPGSHCSSPVRSRCHISRLDEPCVHGAAMTNNAPPQSSTAAGDPGAPTLASLLATLIGNDNSAFCEPRRRITFIDQSPAVGNS